MNKEIEILKVSNPETVYKKARNIFNKGIIIKVSTRKNKKYMLLSPYTNKYIHFGDMRYSDFTKHNDLIRRNKFKIRNMKWSKFDIFSPGFLSYVLLW